MDTYDRSTVAPKCWYSQGGREKLQKERREQREKRRGEREEREVKRSERGERKKRKATFTMPSLIHSQADSFSGEFYPRLQHTPSKPPP